MLLVGGTREGEAVRREETGGEEDDLGLEEEEESNDFSKFILE